MATTNNLIQEWKGYVLSVNDKSNFSDSFKEVASDGVLKLQKDSKDNDFITSITRQFFKALSGSERISEKQAFWIAKIGVEKGFLD